MDQIPSMLALFGGKSHGQVRRALTARPSREIVIREPALTSAGATSPSPGALTAPVTSSVPPEATEVPATPVEEVMAAVAPTTGEVGAGDSGVPRGSTRARAVVLSEDEDQEPLQKWPHQAVSTGEGPSSPRTERGSDFAALAAPAAAAEGLPLPDSERAASDRTWMGSDQRRFEE